MPDQNRYRIEGSYYEACNCDAIFPCRRQNGLEGGLSTYGDCDFILSWAILKGHAGETDLTGLDVCMAGTYDDADDESPWRVFIYVDAAVSDSQMDALGEIFQGHAGGNILFTGNISKVLGIKRARISLDHSKGRETYRNRQNWRGACRGIYRFRRHGVLRYPGARPPWQRERLEPSHQRRAAGVGL